MNKSIIHYRIFLALAILPAFNVFSLQAEPTVAQTVEKTQAQKRAEKPWQISMLPYPGVYEILFGYNISNQLTFGAAFIKNNLAKDSQEVYALGPMALRERDSTKPTGLLFINYFPFEKFPLFGALYAGRSGGSTVKYTETLSMDPLMNPTNDPTFTYTVTTGQYYFGAAGLGFRWLFNSGFHLGIEVARIFRNAPHNTIYLYRDYRSVLTPNERIPSPAEMMLRTRYLESVYTINNTGTGVLLYIGWNF